MFQKVALVANNLETTLAGESSVFSCYVTVLNFGEDISFLEVTGEYLI